MSHRLQEQEAISLGKLVLGMNGKMPRTQPGSSLPLLSCAEAPCPLLSRAWYLLLIPLFAKQSFPNSFAHDSLFVAPECQLQSLSPHFLPGRPPLI